jgi:putative tryptophan/tyrosine transport system substrate-binding protein
MDRRVFIGTLTGGLLAAPLAAQAQPATSVRRILLYATSERWRQMILSALRERGWLEGRDISMQQYREEDAYSHVGEHLGKGPVDVLIMGGPQLIRAGMKATKTIPIIGIDLETDPVKAGFVKTLARPGGNVTGIWMDLPTIAGKQIEFLREVVPRLSRLGVVWDDQVGQAQLVESQSAARAFNVSLYPSALHQAADIDGAMERLLAERVQAVLALTSPVVFRAESRLADLARQNRLPSISPLSTYPAAGGLMAYGPDFPAMWIQVADYVGRVLKGARAGDLPVERPSRFSLIVNLQTAKALGLTIPPSLLQRADQVIE